MVAWSSLLESEVHVGKVGFTVVFLVWWGGGVVFFVLYCAMLWFAVLCCCGLLCGGLLFCFFAVAGFLSRPVVCFGVGVCRCRFSLEPRARPFVAGITSDLSTMYLDNTNKSIDIYSTLRPLGTTLPVYSPGLLC